MRELLWAEFKAFVDSKKLVCQSADLGNYYHVAASDNLLQFFCKVYKDEQEILDDFINNYMPHSNLRVSKPTSAFANNITEEGKTLYLKIHGFTANVPAATLDTDGVTIIPSEHEILFTNPYVEMYLQGAEIFSDVLCLTDMSVKHPQAGLIEQYGFNVVVGAIKYRRQAQYATKLPQ